VAVLDVSETELKNAKENLPEILPVKCNVTSFDDCAAAYQAVHEGFSGAPISFLFNNAGIAGQGGGKFTVFPVHNLGMGYLFIFPSIM
jgi:NAD(P)-dependent dehydrogenase (short-subunit alcohol dehydrogenase family)